MRSLLTGRRVVGMVRNQKAALHLPTPELGGNIVETAGPRHQVFHASCGQQRAVGLQSLYSNVLGISHDASLPQLRRFLGFRAQANGTYAGYRGKSATALLDAL